MTARDGLFNHLTGRSLCPPPRPAEEATGLIGAHRDEVRADTLEDIADLFDYRSRSLAPDAVLTAAEVAALIRQHAAEQAGKGIGGGTQPPADESTQPTPLTDAHTAFTQLLSTPALQGLRAELRVDGHPPLIGTYCGAGTRMANHQPSVLLIEPMLAFEYTEGGDA